MLHLLDFWSRLCSKIQLHDQRLQGLLGPRVAQLRTGTNVQCEEVQNPRESGCRAKYHRRKNKLVDVLSARLRQG